MPGTGPMLDNACRPFRILADIARAAEASDDVDELLQRIIAAMVEAFHARGGTLRVLELPSNTLQLRAAAGLSRAYLEKGPVTVRRTLSQIYAEGPCVIGDIARDPRVQYPQAAAAEGLAAIIEVPFRILPDCHMLLRLYFGAPIAPTEDDMAFLTALGQQGAQAIRDTLTPNRYLKTFRKVSRAVHQGNDTAAILQGIVGQITTLLSAAGCIYWIVDAGGRRIDARICHGFNFRSLAAVDYDTLVTIFDPSPGGFVFIEDAGADGRIPDLRGLGKQNVRTVVGLSFEIEASLVGILAVYFSGRRRLSGREMDLLGVLGEQGAISLLRARRYDANMLATFRQTVEGLVTALEAKDPVTHGHSLQVGTYARRTALAMGFPDREADKLYHAGLLHDIGKIGMTDKILARLGRLTAREMGQIRMHPVIGARILEPLHFLDELVPMIRHHHEHFDGSGYPDGLCRDAIPLGARILTACDALETMLAGRPSMPRRERAEALAELRRGAGTRFDPQVVEALTTVLQQGRKGTPGTPPDEPPAGSSPRFPLGF